VVLRRTDRMTKDRDIRHGRKKITRRRDARLAARDIEVALDNHPNLPCHQFVFQCIRYVRKPYIAFFRSCIAEVNDGCCTSNPWSPRPTQCSVDRNRSRLKAPSQRLAVFFREVLAVSQKPDILASRTRIKVRQRLSKKGSTGSCSSAGVGSLFVEVAAKEQDGSRRDIGQSTPAGKRHHFC